MSLKCGFIGCGNMGGALAMAVSKATVDVSLYLSDANEQKASELAKSFNANVATTLWLVEHCDVVFLGVKPQGMVSLFNEISSVIQGRTSKPILVSMAAGIALETLEGLAGVPLPIVRIMPNTPVKMGLGMIEVCHNTNVTQQQLQLILSLLEKAGKLDVISEDMIDAASAIAGSGPAFIYLFAELLAKGAEECGIPFDKGVEYAAQTLLGSAAMILEGKNTPEELRIAVCSPGGSTLAGLTALENDEFSNAVKQAVLRAFRRSKELGKI